MDFRLKVFKAVADELSYTKAAKLLGISQPAVTKHIQELENIYGLRLFERVGGRILLTNGAKSLLERAGRILSEFDELSNEMRLVSQECGGRLRIGATDTISNYILPRCMAGFARLFPEVELSLVTYPNAGQLNEALKDSSIDLAFRGEWGFSVENSADWLCASPLVMVTSSDTQIQDNISVESLLHSPIIIGGEMSEIAAILKELILHYGLDFSNLHIVMQLDSIGAIRSALANMRGVYAMLPFVAVEDLVKDGRLKVLQSDAIQFNYNIRYIKKSAASGVAAERFIDFIHSSSKSLK